MSVVDGLRELKPHVWETVRMGDGHPSVVEVPVEAWPLLLDVVKAAFAASEGHGYCIDCGVAWGDPDEPHTEGCRLAALESAQGADKPETGAGA